MSSEKPRSVEADRAAAYMRDCEKAVRRFDGAHKSRKDYAKDWSAWLKRAKPVQRLMERCKQSSDFKQLRGYPPQGVPQRIHDAVGALVEYVTADTYTRDLKDVFSAAEFKYRDALIAACASVGVMVEAVSRVEVCIEFVDQSRIDYVFLRDFFLYRLTNGRKGRDRYSGKLRYAQALCDPLAENALLWAMEQVVSVSGAGRGVLEHARNAMQTSHHPFAATDYGYQINFDRLIPPRRPQYY